MWSHLSRYEGGIGMRGPGETQLETDKRLVQRRIRAVRRKLDEIEERRELALDGQRRDFVIALVGYTNVGKSTLLNKLTGSSEFVEDKLFATLDTRTRRWPIDARRHVLVNDTVGFIRQLPHHLVASFHATLAETREADLLFHVVDAAAPQAARQVRTVEDVLRGIGCAEKPCWLLLNKWDRLTGEGREVEARHLGSTVPAGTPVFEVSAATGHGLEALRRAVAARLDEENRRVSVLLPHQRGELLAWVRGHGKVVAEEHDEKGTRLVVDMSPARIEKLRAMWPEALDGGR
jgi:GTP-binding protein HflX